MNKSSISWTDGTWNVVRGRQISKGCRNCYAMETAHRVNKAHAASGLSKPYEGLVQIRSNRSVWTGFITKLLVDPLRRQKPSRIFVNSMSDLWFERLTFEQIAAVFGIMAPENKHIYQVLTKRPDRMVEWFDWVAHTAVKRGITSAQLCFEHARLLGASNESAMKVLDRSSVIIAATNARWPLPNVCIGVSAEDQTNANVRVPLLVTVPAALRFVSAEPLLGPLELTPWLTDLGWLIAGCESGDGRRRADVGWFRGLRDQCASARSAYSLKQASADEGITLGAGSKKKKNGIIETPAVDGTVWAGFPTTMLPSGRSVDAPTTSFRVEPTSGSSNTVKPPKRTAETVLEQDVP